MVEPLAAVIRNSLNRYPALSSVTRKIHSFERTSLTNNFFTPAPRKRCAKGEYSTPHPDACQQFVTQCRDWSCCITRHSSWCLSRNWAWNLNSDSNLGSSLRKRRSYQNLQTSDKCFLSPRNYVHPPDSLRVQRRHASLPAEPILSAAPGNALADSGPMEFSFVPTEVSNLRSFCTVAPLSKSTLGVAWEAYSKVVDRQLAGFLAPQEYLHFAHNLIGKIEILDPKENEETIKKWGFRIQTLLKPLAQQVGGDTPLQLAHLESLVVRSYVLIGDYHAALAGINNMRQKYNGINDDAITKVYGRIVLSLAKTQPPIRLFEFLILEWKAFTERLFFPKEAVHKNDPILSFRKTIKYAIINTRQPASIISKFSKGFSRNDSNSLSKLLMKVLTDGRRTKAALDVIEESRRQSLHLDLPLTLTIVEQLARERKLSSATRVLSYIADRSPEWHYAALYIASKKGDVKEAETIFETLDQAGVLISDTKAFLLRAYLNAGDISGLQARFERFFPKGEDGRRQNMPGSNHYTAVLHGVSKRNNGADIQKWVDDLYENGLAVRKENYASLLQFYANQNDADAVVSLFKQMNEAGFQGDAVLYTIAIAFFARRGDALAAEALYRRAIKEDFGNYQQMIIALMNAYAEAGLWAGVFKSYRYLESLQKPGRQLPVEVFNTLFKALIHIGTPFQVLYQQYLKLKSMNMQPDPYTYSLLALSAADAGQMDYSAEVYHECLERHEEEPYAGFLNPVIFTIVMDGYLRQGKNEDAKAVYDEMIRRGLRPNSVTFGSIIKASAKQNKPETLELTQRFVQALHAISDDDGWKTLPNGRGTWYEQIYGPLFKIYSQNLSVKDVQRLYQDVVDKGGEPTFWLHVQLLDVYRRSFDLAGVLQTWPQILTMMTNYTNASNSIRKTGASFPSRPASSGLFCMALSIYIDALSSAGLHSEVPRAWNEFEQRGVAFDPHNWNHLVVALVRAGRPERAFEVLETVILPYQDAFINCDLDVSKTPKSPLLFNDRISQPSQGYFRVPGSNILAVSKGHQVKARVDTMRYMNAKLVLYPKILAETNNFADSSRSLFDVSPVWKTWRVHGNVLKTLLLVVSRLQSGDYIPPINTGESSTLFGPEAASGEAQSRLSWIIEHCPTAFQEVMDFRSREKNRLGHQYEKHYERQ